jgi:hypothetical protein
MALHMARRFDHSAEFPAVRGANQKEAATEKSTPAHYVVDAIARDSLRRSIRE